MSVRIIQGDCREVMKGLPDNSVDSIVTDLAAGHAAEHLVCADLLLQGFKAFLTDQVCAYDVAVDVAGRLVRVQVKATREPRAIARATVHRAAYMWHVRRAGKNGARTYDPGEFDMLALVALDCRRIAYLAPSLVRQTIHIRSHDEGEPSKFSKKPGKTFSAFTFSNALAEVGK